MAFVQLIMILVVGVSLIIYCTLKKEIIKQALLAFAISLVWVFFSGLYTYSEENFIFFHINLFPVIMWTGGLVLSKQIYEKLKQKEKFSKKYWRNFIFMFLIYGVCLVLLEYIGYHILGIHLTSNYYGLFGLPIMHLPLFGKFYYFLIAPFFLYLTDILEIT